MNGFVSKPVAPERLAAVIEAVMINGATDATTVVGWPLLDERVLDLLARDIGDAGANDVVRLFLSVVPRMIDRLEQSFASRGCVLLREVHTLAGAACSVGLLRVGHAAADIELTLAGAEPDGEQLAGCWHCCT
jgi:HPt (histidine-containing phosphotransfer) domain-containing protein